VLETAQRNFGCASGLRKTIPVMPFRILPTTPELCGLIDFGYTVRVDHSRDPVLPDGRSAIVWLSDGALDVCGPHTRPWRPGRSDIDVIGLRIALGATSRVLGVPAWRLTDQRIALRDIWGPDAESLAEHVAAALGAEAVVRSLELAVLQRLKASPRADPVAELMRAKWSQTCATVSEVARDACLSERQLRRRCESAFGYSPSTLARLLRLQRFATLARMRMQVGATLAELAALAGYADQSHLCRECRALTGLRAATVLHAVIAG
jgi:AraC-like DNA-binding protein